MQEAVPFLTHVRWAAKKGLIIQGSGFLVPELSVHDPQHWSVASGAPGWIEKNLALEGQKSRISGSTGLLVLLYYYVCNS
jgi:hypothetical protein